MNTNVFHNANIIDCTGNDPYLGTVVVEGDRIQAVGPADQVTTPRDAVAIDLEGLTLMPGLIDVHTHLGMVIADETKNVEDYHPGATYPFLVAQQIEECLMSGFTTIRDAGMMDWSFKHTPEDMVTSATGITTVLPVLLTDSCQRPQCVTVWMRSGTQSGTNSVPALTR